MKRLASMATLRGTVRGALLPAASKEAQSWFDPLGGWPPGSLPPQARGRRMRTTRFAWMARATRKCRKRAITAVGGGAATAAVGVAATAAVGAADGAATAADTGAGGAATAPESRSASTAVGVTGGVATAAAGAAHPTGEPGITA